tara:strand:- start:756 stop:1172 length:417 start_codon:yes stop_codon:yes gene_type:complete
LNSDLLCFVRIGLDDAFILEDSSCCLEVSKGVLDGTERKPSLAPSLIDTPQPPQNLEVGANAKPHWSQNLGLFLCVILLIRNHIIVLWDMWNYTSLHSESIALLLMEKYFAPHANQYQSKYSHYDICPERIFSFPFMI